MSNVPRILAAVLTLATTAATSFADTRASDPSPAEPKNPGHAVLWSLGGTLVGGALVAGAMVEADKGHTDLAGADLAVGLVAPSAGEIYAGQYLTYGMGIRAVSAGVFLVGAAKTDFGCGWGPDSQRSECPPEDRSAVPLMLLGLAGYAAGTAYDLLTAPEAARAYNRKHAPHVSVTPTALPTSQGPAMGMALGGTF